MTLADPTTLGLAALAALAGLAAGWVHFASLAPIARMLTQGRMLAVALQVARLAVLGLVLWGFARGGALVLVAGAAGILAGRALVMRRVRP
ncbi:MAG: hypothetical protein H6898_14445 [Rhodobacter sp.]|nr:hypothetical protein [Paracoccaceae bacterium]MCC0077757.1 hypothetical protein [Rhodobacter sp.]